MPIASSALIKKYILQTRDHAGKWQEYAAFKNLGEAKDALQKLKRQQVNVEARILNRLTKQVVRL